MATAKQLAWRKEFVKRVKAGTLTKKRKPAAKRKANPARKRKSPAKIPVSARSRATGKPPTKRLKARRAANTKPGVFPNPIARMYRVYTVKADGSRGYLIAGFPTKPAAREYARAWAKKTGKSCLCE